ncbi:MAG: GIY-YIG nuclease family protein [Bacilli bacterium]|jgi:bis(5'-nucleosidyl)-tetraphosphatase
MLKKNYDNMHYVYILRCKDGTLYTGWTINLENRLECHNAGHGAKYTKPRLPVELVYYEEFTSKSEALKREAELKKITRREKLKLIEKNLTREKSAGAVVYYKENNNFVFLIEKMKLGHYSLPKGHMEKGETEAETALREIKEETNLNVKVDTGFRKVISYFPYQGVRKEVVFFVAEAKDKSFIKQEEEIAELFWLCFEEALNLLTFKSDQEVLEEALYYLKSQQ